MADVVIDATDETFVTEVLEASQLGPVVVDFWAPWCEPCRVLGPTLERVAAESPGVTLVKVNIDESPQVAQAYAIESIPAVKAFRDGEVVNEFLGAQGEPEVRQFFTSLVPSEADGLADRGHALLAAGNIPAARQQFEAILAEDPGHGAAAAGLLAILVDAGEVDAATALASEHRGVPEVDRLAALLRFIRDSEGIDPDALLNRVEENEEDAEAQYLIGCALARSGEWEAALECFLAVVQADRGYREDAGRLAMLDLFTVLTNEHPLTNEYRSRLTMLLF